MNRISSKTFNHDRNHHAITLTRTARQKVTSRIFYRKLQLPGTRIAPATLRYTSLNDNISNARAYQNRACAVDDVAARARSGVDGVDGRKKKFFLKKAR